ncbi:putative ribonuclease H-like domain-containing protein [Tanacetum coccineum]
MALQKDHLAKFHKMTDAKEMWDAIKSRFGGNDESKKMQKYILKQQFERFSISNSEGLHKGYDRFQSLLSQLEIHERGRVDSLSFDDLYNNLRVFENDVKGYTASSSSTQNVAFISKNTSGTNDLDEFDLEEMDLKWQVAMISMRMKKFYKKTGRKLQFDAKEPVAVLTRIGKIPVNTARASGTNNLVLLGEKGKLLLSPQQVVIGDNKDTTGTKSPNTMVDQDYPHRTLQNKGIVDSGCSRHMTGNKAYLAEYQDLNGGPPVAFWRKCVTEFKNMDFIEFCGSKGIKREYSNSRTLQQNGVAERKNRTLIEAARTMLADPFLPNTFWAEAVSTACYVLNRVLVTKPHNKTPYELITGPQKANHNAGTKDNIDAGNSEKEDESAQDYFVLPIWSSYSSTVKRSTAKDAGEALNKHPDLKTDEKPADKEDQVFLDELERHKRREQNANDAAKALRKEFAQETEDLLLQAGAAKTSSTNIVNTASTPVRTVSPYDGLSFSDPTNPDQDDSEIPALEDIYKNPTDGIFTNSSYDDEGAMADFTFNLENIVPSRGLACLIANATIDESNKWHRRLGHVNFKNLKKLVKGNLVRGLPLKIFQNDHTCVACQKGKQHKASFAQGHRQEEGIDYDEVFAPVARIKAIRIILAFATYMGFIVYQMDVKSAFLYGKIDEEVYVSPPPGFIDPKYPKKVYKVVKALYGLHQAPKAWYATLSTFLLKNGYRRGTIEEWTET